MTVKHYDHTIIDITDVPTNPFPRDIPIEKTDEALTPTPRPRGHRSWYSASGRRTADS